MIARVSFPPLGWFVAVAAATMVAIWSQPEEVILPSRPDFALAESKDQPGLALALHSGDPETEILVISKRPLLAEGRRPFVSAVAEPAMAVAPDPVPDPIPAPEPEVALEPPAVKLIGTMLLDGKSRVLVLDLATGSETWMELGQSIAGWQISEVDDGILTLRFDAAEITLQQFDNALP